MSPRSRSAIASTFTAASLVFAACWLVATPSWAQTTRYRIVEGSTLTAECIPCAIPPITMPIRGSASLTVTETDPLFQRFAVADFAFAGAGLAEYDGTGAGMYRVGGEVALVQEMSLRMNIGEHRGLTLESKLGPTHAPVPWIEIDVAQDPKPEQGWFFTLHLVLAPWPRMWFSTRYGFHPADPAAVGQPVVTEGDLLSAAGTVDRTNTELTRRLGIMPVASEIGLDAVGTPSRRRVSAGPEGEIYFSARSDVFSETVGMLHHGDLLSDSGKVIRRNADLIAPFSPMPPIPDLGLDAAAVDQGGLVVFSTRDGFFSERLGRTIDRGDLLREDGTVLRSQEEFLALFQPAAGVKSVGVDAVHIWRHGEVWFSTEDSFEDERFGHVGHGDLLSDTGRIVARNHELLGPFKPLDEIADFGLDAVLIDSAASFQGCGVLVQGAECVLFRPDSRTPDILRGRPL